MPDEIKALLIAKPSLVSDAPINLFVGNSFFSTFPVVEIYPSVLRDVYYDDPIAFFNYFVKWDEIVTCYEIMKQFVDGQIASVAFIEILRKQFRLLLRYDLNKTIISNSNLEWLLAIDIYPLETKIEKNNQRNRSLRLQVHRRVLSILQYLKNKCL